MATYFVDVINGKTENDGLSEKTPVSDYERLDVKAGDTVLFKRGSFIRGRLNNKEGEPGKPITYAAYGEGEKPTFCGSVNVSDEKMWVEEDENIWVCSSKDVEEAANFIFNKTDLCGTLRWTKEELKEQGDFFDNCFGFSNTFKDIPKEHKIYMYSEKNPGAYYSDIECVVCNERSLACNGHDMIFKDLKFINNGIHAIAGKGETKNMKVCDCSFEYIGGAVWSYKSKIRFGNGVEMWNICENVEITDCIFNNIYDSAVTHQGDEKCEPCVNLICEHNIFIKCGMAAYEQRDILPLSAKFNNNICIDAGEGFSKNGEIMPRYSEIWPQPMGHHVFLWRIEKETEGGGLEIKNNIFYNAPYGAAIYSIISEKAEGKTVIEANAYYTENKELINRWGGINYMSFDEYKNSEKDCKYEKVDINGILNRIK